MSDGITIGISATALATLVGLVARLAPSVRSWLGKRATLAERVTVLESKVDDVRIVCQDHGKALDRVHERITQESKDTQSEIAGTRADLARLSGKLAVRLGLPED